MLLLFSSCYIEPYSNINVNVIVITVLQGVEVLSEVLEVLLIYIDVNWWDPPDDQKSHYTNLCQFQLHKNFQPLSGLYKLSWLLILGIKV